MPLSAHQLYLVRFKIGDMDFIAAAHSEAYKNADHKVFINKEISRGIEANPDAKVTSIEPVDDYRAITQAVVGKKLRRPDQPHADELGLDTPNRLISNPEVSQAITANRT